jgi:drug/metabolite transporter (DMT)-like permease
VLVGLAAAFCCCPGFGVAAILQAIAARSEGRGGSVDPALLVRMLRHPVFVVALVLNLAGFLLHFEALRSLPLFLAQTIISSSVAVTAVLSARVLKSPLTWHEYAAVAAVCLGLALASSAAGTPRRQRPAPGGRSLLLVAAATVALAGLLAGRADGARGAFLLGLVAGLGFAVVAIAARVLPSLSPGALIREPAAYALVISGVVAFMIYSAAMQRGIGGHRLGRDGPRPDRRPVAGRHRAARRLVRMGWAPVAVLGVVLAATGVIRLSHFETSPVGALSPHDLTPQT